MGLLDFQSLSIWLNMGIFAAGAVVVWLAGTRLSHYADAIADRTGAGHAFIGALLLGGMTSLPEVTTTLTASLSGNAPLAVNNIFGGVAMQVAILAGLDLFVRKRAISSLVERPAVVLQGPLCILVLGVAIGGMVVGETGLLWFGLWSLLTFLAALTALYLTNRYERSERWELKRADEEDEETLDFNRRGQEKAEERERRVRELSGGRLTLYTVLAGLAILVGGFFVARTGDALAEQTGLGSSFVGAVFVAVATSLPEVSTTYSALLLRNYRMAFSNIFGTNIFDVGILFLADVTYRHGLVLDEVGSFAQFGALLGVMVTGVYVVGLLMHRRRTFLRFGLDSLIVLLIYVGGVAVLYSLRGSENDRAGARNASDSVTVGYVGVDSRRL